MRDLTVEHPANEEPPINENIVLLKIKGLNGRYRRALGYYNHPYWYEKYSDIRVNPTGWFFLVDVNGE
jgi:hypothetical protein